ncbi:unnamed protein product [Urochloa humidicola]
MRGLGRGAWACLWVALLLLLVQLAGASHVVYDYEKLEAEAATEAVPPSIVDPGLRTGYHFQPPKNWINGNANIPNQLPYWLSDPGRIEGATCFDCVC